MAWLYERGREKTSQARALSGIKSFFNFLMISDKIESSPAEFVLTPKFGRQLPDVLTTPEIDRIIATVDTSTPKGLRDCAMLEVLYSCGLRVSELTSLRMQDLFFGEGYIRVIGKGDKQRLVPISATARDRIQFYLEKRRSARAGEEVAVRQALITIYEMEIVEYALPRVRIRVRCSKGTYIRSLAHEIGQALRSGAHLSSLRRTRSGGFTLEKAYELDDFLENLQKIETK